MSFVHGCSYISIVNPIVKIAIIYNGIHFAINSFQSVFDSFSSFGSDIFYTIMSFT